MVVNGLVWDRMCLEVTMAQVRQRKNKGGGCCFWAVDQAVEGRRNEVWFVLVVRVSEKWGMFHVGGKGI